MLAAAHDRLSAAGQRTLLFIDEIHRFNKAQQDVLLPDVEDGVVILVGATTRKPVLHDQQRRWSAAAASSSSSRFRPTTSRRCSAGPWPIASAAWAADKIHACTTTPWSSWPRPATATPAGRSRRWRSACSPAPSRPVEFTRQLAEESVQRKAVQYDRQGDAHYDVDQRADQEHPRQRPRRGPLLAGADARRGRRRAVPRPAAGDPGQRGRGQCRSGRPCRWPWPRPRPANWWACPSANSTWPRR